MPRLSRFAIIVDNLSTSTPTKDVEYEASAAGRIRDIVRDHKARCALIEYERSADAKWAWTKLDGLRMDGRRWKVDYATPDDFRFFGWKWFEGPPSPYRGRSRSPPNTPHDSKDRKPRGNSASPSHRGSRSRSPTPQPRDD